MKFWQRAPVLLTAGVLLTIIAIVSAVVAIRRHEGESPAAGSPATGTKLTAPQAAEGFVAGATADVTAVTAYDYRSLDLALASGSAVTTGGYRRSFRAALNGALGEQARAQRIVQTFQQTAAGIGTMSGDLQTAKVLIFGIQTVTRGGGAPVNTAITLTASVVHQGDRYLISKLEAGANAGVPTSSADVTDAAETARRQTVAALTLRRATLAADYAAALADTVDPIRTELAKALTAERADVQRGRYELRGAVTALGIESAVADRVVVLVAATGYRSKGSVESVADDARLRVTVNKIGNVWRVSDSQSVDG